MIARFASLVAIVSLLAACAPTTGRHAGFIGATPSANDGAATTKITVLHTSKLPSAGSFDIYQDDRLVGEIRPNQYLVWETTVPADGRLFISTKGRLVEGDMAVVKPVAGGESFLAIELVAALADAQTHLVPASPAEAEAFMSRAGEAKLQKTGPARLGK